MPTRPAPRPGPRLGLALLLAPLLLSAMPSPAFANYWVYCVHGRIRIESRPPADVGRSYISTSWCQLGAAFRHVSDARSFATNNWGGEGRSCSCR